MGRAGGAPWAGIWVRRAGWVCRQEEQQVRGPECLGIPGPALSPQPASAQILNPASGQEQRGPSCAHLALQYPGSVSQSAADTHNTGVHAP